MKQVLFPVGLLLFIIVLAFANSLFILPIFFGIISLYFLFFNQKNLIKLYLILLPINNLIYKEDYLFGIVGIDIITNILTIYYLLYTTNTTKKLNGLNRLTISLILLFMLYYPYLTFKEVYYSIGSTDISYAFMKTINWVLKLTPLILLIYKYENIKIKENIESGVFQSIIFLGILSVFNTFFISIGLYSTMAGTRINGFLNSGNANTLGGYFVIVLVYMLIKYEEGRFKILDISLILISFIVIAMSGSRASFISMSAVLLLYLSHAKLSLNFIKMLIGIAIVAVLVYPLFSTTFKRMTTVEDEQFAYHGTSNRYGKWMYYLEDIAEHPDNILTGTDHDLYMHGRITAAHNLYVTMLFEGGILFPFILILIQLRLIMIRKKYGYDLLYFIIPMVLISMGNSEMGIYWLFIVLSGVLVKKNEINGYVRYSR